MFSCSHLTGNYLFETTSYRSTIDICSVRLTFFLTVLEGHCNHGRWNSHKTNEFRVAGWPRTLEISCHLGSLLSTTLISPPSIPFPSAYFFIQQHYSTRAINARPPEYHNVSKVWIGIHAGAPVETHTGSNDNENTQRGTVQVMTVLSSVLDMCVLILLQPWHYQLICNLKC